MVLSELTSSISGAIQRLNNALVVDDRVLTECLNKIIGALIKSDVRFEIIRGLHADIRRLVNLETVATGHNRRLIIHNTIFMALCNMLTPGAPSFIPKKGRCTVVMFVGLEGAGKTTTCAKYARHYKKKGYKPALVCADTFRDGAYDQLRQNAWKANIPFYGSTVTKDPIRVAKEGVEDFRNENKHDLIIVDTSGRHRQSKALFEEIKQLRDSVEPDLVVFVMDGSIGQAAFDQAVAFQQAISVGAVIVTKMDGPAKEGGALSAVAATQSPVIFLRTGEHLEDLQPFMVEPFVKRLMGKTDLACLVHRINDVLDKDQQQEIERQMKDGVFNLKMMHYLYSNILEMGNLGEFFTMIPRLRREFMPEGREKESQRKIRRYITIMDSMTEKELMSSDLKFMKESRIMRIARGSGSQVIHVNEMLEQFKHLQNIMGRMKKFDISSIVGMLQRQGMRR